jgi:hypothetical protein
MHTPYVWGTWYWKEKFKKQMVSPIGLEVVFQIIILPHMPLLKNISDPWGFLFVLFKSKNPLKVLVCVSVFVARPGIELKALNLQSRLSTA